MNKSDKYDNWPSFLDGMKEKQTDHQNNYMHDVAACLYVLDYDNDEAESMMMEWWECCRNLGCVGSLPAKDTARAIIDFRTVTNGAGYQVTDGDKHDK